VARLPAAERRRQLLDVALEAFGTEGFHATSMNDVAEAAGVTKPVLYQHFGSKRELYLELLRDVGGQLRDEVGKAVATAATPREQVERGFAAFFGWVADHRGGFAVLFAGETRRDPEFVREALEVETDMADTIATLIVVEGLDREQARLLAYGIVGTAETTARHWLHDDVAMSPEELAASVGRLAWAGLRGLRP
jgi:AcrR family transcriptional regulator